MTSPNGSANRPAAGRPANFGSASLPLLRGESCGRVRSPLVRWCRYRIVRTVAVVAAVVDGRRWAAMGLRAGTGHGKVEARRKNSSRPGDHSGFLMVTVATDEVDINSDASSDISVARPRDLAMQVGRAATIQHTIIPSRAMVFRHCLGTHRWLWLLAGFATACEGFQFPKIKFVGITPKEDLNSPQRLIKNGAEDAEKLRKRVELYCQDIVQTNFGSEVSKEKAQVLLRWEPDLQESYEVADVVFQVVAQVLPEGDNGNQQAFKETGNSPYHVILSFPSMLRPEALEELAAVLQSEKCKQLLGLENASAELYPSSPAPYICISSPSAPDANYAPRNSQIREGVDNMLCNDESAAHVSATEHWLKHFLGKYNICPYTSSVSRAAVGLSSVGVPVGGVHVQVASTRAEESQRTSSASIAAELVSSFWAEVAALMQSPQEKWATSLVVFPAYDEDFASFVNVCDNIIEPTVEATRSTDFIGRAWFHPQYDADAVGHSEVIAGHAVPHKMVQGFMKSLYSPGGKDGSVPLEYDELVKANNEVRHTPHATINILRRSQLAAAAEYEKGLGEKRPKANSIYVRNAVRLSEITWQQNK
ncbi:hypothetical protein ACHAWF_009077 [Thalassiosira exigua]